MNHLRQDKISVIIPVLHESKRINDLVAHVKNLVFPGEREIIVVDGGPERETLAAMRDPEPLRLAGWPGRAVQMNLGAAESSGSILVFLHADTRLPKDGPVLAARSLSRPGVMAGAFSLGFDREDPALRLTAFGANLRNRVVRTPYGDQAQFFRAAFFRNIGGFAEIGLMEDVEIFRRMRKLGVKTETLRPKVRTSARRYREEGVLKRGLKNNLLRLGFALGLDPNRLARMYGSKRRDQ